MIHYSSRGANTSANYVTLVPEKQHKDHPRRWLHSGFQSKEASFMPFQSSGDKRLVNHLPAESRSILVAAMSRRV
jgi:hypothetical protein